MRTRLNTAMTVLLFACCALFAGHLLFSAIAAFSAQNYLMSDYGVYTNTIYNLAHGNGFKFMVDHSYLKTHLSFSLILLAPLFWIFKTPMLLIFVQWLFLIGGCTILFRIMQRRGIDLTVTAGILFFVCAYPMTQSVMLSEFHGVSAYYLLIPWLVHELLYRKRLAIIPLTCILGLREDAGLVVLPILLFFAVSERWKTAYVLAGVSLLYVIMAVTVLYPVINGESLFAVRADEASHSGILSSWNPRSLMLRAEALGWLLLPTIPVAVICGRRWKTLLVFPSAAFLVAVCSGFERQHSFAFHYPAPVIAAIACGMAVSIMSNLNRARSSIAIGTLAAFVLLAHIFNGFFLGSKNAHQVYQQIDPVIQSLRALNKAASREGMLMASRKTAPHFAMREDIMTFYYFDRDNHAPELIVCSTHDLLGSEHVWIRTQVQNGNYGPIATAEPYLLLKRGAKPAPQLLENPSFSAVLMPSHGGSTYYDEQEGLCRYWPGIGRKAPITLAYGVGVPLTTGRYEAVFRIKALKGRDVDEKGWGVLSLHQIHKTEALAKRKVSPTESISGFAEVAVPFELNTDMTVEPRITGGGAKLWAKSVTFRKRD